jgi:hypothetical protein
VKAGVGVGDDALKAGGIERIPAPRIGSNGLDYGFEDWFHGARNAPLYGMLL